MFHSPVLPIPRCLECLWSRCELLPCTAWLLAAVSTSGGLPGCWCRPTLSDRSSSRGRGQRAAAPSSRHSHSGGQGQREGTHDSILHAEAQLVLEVWPLDEDCGDRGAADDVELHLRLVLQTLQSMGTGVTRDLSCLCKGTLAGLAEDESAGLSPGVGGMSPGETGSSGPPCPSLHGQSFSLTRVWRCWVPQVAVHAVAHCAQVCPQPG